MSRSRAVPAFVAAGYGWFAVVVGLWALAEILEPTVFGFRRNSDGPPAGAEFAWGLLAIGAALIGALVATVRGSQAARLVACLALGALLAFGVFVITEWSDPRRCSRDSYTETSICMSPKAAQLRDVGLFVGPGAIALGVLAWPRRKRSEEVGPGA